MGKSANFVFQLSLHKPVHLSVVMLHFSYVCGFFLLFVISQFRMELKPQSGFHSSTHKKVVPFLSEGTLADHLCSGLSMRAVGPELMLIS